ncbi:MAG: FKBP-type peptidyl-prolyl cis-trans isomerase [Butyrivibrio sp.]|nr:FKBP-type peptidyl-prolyl cis-trans isomerase [Butyrivibrio sp.]
MKIAVTYENGEVFQHFGHTEQFKVYEVEDGKVVSSEVLDSNGTGHGALAGLLANNDINVLICGGIGGGAKAALDAGGIELCAGAKGDADRAVEAYLNGELVNSGVNCDHHGEGHTCGDHEDGHSCGHHEGGHCGHHDEAEEDADEGGCASGGCGGCHGCHQIPLVEGPNAGKTCRTHYIGTFNDGTQFDSSYDRGEPLEFICGSGMMIHGFDEAVANMNVGDIIDIHLEPSQAYGDIDPEAIFSVEISELPGSEDLAVGEKAYLQDMYGRPIPVKVVEKNDNTITFDANHEMAGKELNFKIELVEVIA